MTAPDRLAAAGRRVVLVGAAHHGDNSALEDLPNVSDTVEAVRARRGEPTPPMHDPASPAEIGEVLLAQAQRATDVPLFHFCGHCLIGGDGQSRIRRRLGPVAPTSPTSPTPS